MAMTDLHTSSRPAGCARRRAAATLSGESVHLARDAFRDYPAGQVAAHERRVSLARVTIAAGAGRDDGHRLPRPEKGLRSHGRRAPRAVDDLAFPALVAAEEAPRRRPAAAAMNEGLAFVILGPNLTAQAETAAPAAGSARVLHERVTLHDERVLGLERLHRQIGGVGDVHMDTVEAVLGRSRARAAADGLEVHVELTGPRIDTAERRRHARTIARRDDPLGNGRGQGAVDQIDDALAGLRTRRHHGRSHTAEHTARPPP